MALIAVAVDRSGAARMFFDLRATRPAEEDERRIAAAIACAGTLAREGAEAQLPRAA